MCHATDLFIHFIYIFGFGYLSVLSQRLGLGKGGLRMAPEEALQELLQVSISRLLGLYL